MKRLVALLLILATAFALAGCNKEMYQGKLDWLDGKIRDYSDDFNVFGEDAEGTYATDDVTKNIKVIVVHSGGSNKSFVYETKAVFLGPLLEAEGLIKGNEGPYGMEITEVDGEKAVYAEDNAYWALYEGEEYALQGIDTTRLTDEGVYKLVYTGA